MSGTDLDPAKLAFIEAAIAHGVLLFGTFTLKSGRQVPPTFLTPISPYFFNAGLLYKAALLEAASNAYAKLLVSSRFPEFDVLFGPAYKGIPLAAITSVALWRDHGRDQGYSYNRKEAKDHGEGGSLVGAPLNGRIVIIDDVVTSGKAIREAIALIQQYPEAKLVGIVQLVDRQERGQGQTGLSTVQEVEKEYGIPVEAILTLDDVLRYVEQKGGMEKELKEIKKYREQYAIKA